MIEFIKNIFKLLGRKNVNIVDDIDSHIIISKYNRNNQAMILFNIILILLFFTLLAGFSLSIINNIIKIDKINLILFVVLFMLDIYVRKLEGDTIILYKNKIVCIDWLSKKEICFSDISKIQIYESNNNIIKFCDINNFDEIFIFTKNSKIHLNSKFSNYHLIKKYLDINYNIFIRCEEFNWRRVIGLFIATSLGILSILYASELLRYLTRG